MEYHSNSKQKNCTKHVDCLAHLTQLHQGMFEGQSLRRSDTHCLEQTIQHKDTSEVKGLPKPVDQYQVPKTGVCTWLGNHPDTEFERDTS